MSSPGDTWARRKQALLWCLTGVPPSLDTSEKRVRPVNKARGGKGIVIIKNANICFKERMETSLHTSTHVHETHGHTHERDKLIGQNANKQANNSSNIKCGRATNHTCRRPILSRKIISTHHSGQRRNKKLSVSIFYELIMHNSKYIISCSFLHTYDLLVPQRDILRGTVPLPAALTDSQQVQERHTNSNYYNEKTHRDWKSVPKSIISITVQAVTEITCHKKRGIMNPYIFSSISEFFERRKKNFSWKGESRFYNQAMQNK